MKPSFLYRSGMEFQPARSSPTFENTETEEHTEWSAAEAVEEAAREAVENPDILANHIQAASPEIGSEEAEKIAQKLASPAYQSSLKERIKSALKPALEGGVFGFASAAVTKSAIRNGMVFMYGGSLGVGIAAGAAGGAVVEGVKAYLKERKKIVAGSITEQIHQAKSPLEKAVVLKKAEQALKDRRILEPEQTQELEALVKQTRAEMEMLVKSPELAGASEVKKMAYILKLANEERGKLDKLQKKEVKELFNRIEFQSQRGKVDKKRVAVAALRGAAIGAAGGAIGGAISSWIAEALHPSVVVEAAGSHSTDIGQQQLTQKMESATLAASESLKQARERLLEVEYQAVAEKGQGLTHLVRKGLHDYIANLHEIGNSQSLVPEQMVYAEDYLVKQQMQHGANSALQIGESVKFSGSALQDALDHARKLTPVQMTNMEALLKTKEHFLSEQTREWMVDFKNLASPENDYAKGLLEKARAVAAEAVVRVEPVPVMENVPAAPEPSGRAWLEKLMWYGAGVATGAAGGIGAYKYYLQRKAKREAAKRSESETVIEPVIPPVAPSSMPETAASKPEAVLPEEKNVVAEEESAPIIIPIPVPILPVEEKVDIAPPVSLPVSQPVLPDTAAGDLKNLSPADLVVPQDTGTVAVDILTTPDVAINVSTLPQTPVPPEITDKFFSGPIQARTPEEYEDHPGHQGTRAFSTYALSKMSDRDITDLDKPTGAERDAVFQEKVKKLFDKIAVHGVEVKDKATRKIVLKERTDIDGECAVGLLSLAHINTSKITFIKKGASLPGGFNVDTGNRDNVTVDVNDLTEEATLFADHHGPESADNTSSTKLVYETLTELGLLKREEYLDRLVEFITQIDNKAFPNEEKYYEIGDKTILGMYKFLRFKHLVEYFKSGRSPVEQLSPLDLKAFGIQKWTQEVINKRTESKAGLAELEQKGFIAESPKYGKIVIDHFSNGKRRVPDGWSAAKAAGYDGYVLWNPESGFFFVSVKEPISFTLPQGRQVRGHMWIAVDEDRTQPLKFGLGTLLEALGVPKDSLQGDMKSYVEEEEKKAAPTAPLPAVPRPPMPSAEQQTRQELEAEFPEFTKKLTAAFDASNIPSEARANAFGRFRELITQLKGEYPRLMPVLEYVNVLVVQNDRVNNPNWITNIKSDTSSNLIVIDFGGDIPAQATLYSQLKRVLAIL